MPALASLGVDHTSIVSCSTCNKDWVSWWKSYDALGVGSVYHRPRGVCNRWWLLAAWVKRVSMVCFHVVQCSVVSRGGRRGQLIFRGD